MVGSDFGIMNDRLAYGDDDGRIQPAATHVDQ